MDTDTHFSVLHRSFGIEMQLNCLCTTYLNIMLEYVIVYSKQYTLKCSLQSSWNIHNAMFDCRNGEHTQSNVIQFCRYVRASPGVDINVNWFSLVQFEYVYIVTAISGTPIFNIFDILTDIISTLQAKANSLNNSFAVMCMRFRIDKVIDWFKFHKHRAPGRMKSIHSVVLKTHEPKNHSQKASFRISQQILRNFHHYQSLCLPKNTTAKLREYLTPQCWKGQRDGQSTPKGQIQLN